MKNKIYIFLISSMILFSCGEKKSDRGVGQDQAIGQHEDLKYVQDAPNSILKFANKVLEENLRIYSCGRSFSRYLDVQMLFETEELLGYTTFSNELYQEGTDSNDYEGCILFVASYNDLKSAEYAFNHLKANSKTRLSEIVGLAGLVVEQVQVLERIRMSGGMFTQKGKHVFYLPETCGEPQVGASWSDYENLFLGYITENGEEIEVINADCGKDELSIQYIKASR